MIERTFQDIPEGRISDADQHSYLVSLGWYRGDTWDSLLRSKRILIVSEAGGGKTHECQSLCKQLFNMGQPAFFLELASLASNDLRTLLEPDHEARFEEWLISQSEVATFCLDSFDELKLSQGSFDIALKRLRKAIGGNLERARIIITTRPVPFDEKLIRKLLPVPQAPVYEVNSETFAQIALHGTAGLKKTDEEIQAPDWRKVALIPLSDDQILEFAATENVENPKSLLADLKKRNAEEFARRPQDLIELCADWRVAKRIRNHRQQVKANIQVKLKPRDDRAEPAELSVEKATEGASRLALAMILMRRFTIRHSAEADQGIDEAAIDPTLILHDWALPARKALLERPLFGFASYGRVRFHHRSVMEYLAAERLEFLRTQGMPSRALKRLLFAETRGTTVARPSKRPVAAWLALANEMVFEILRDNEPGVLLAEGDPESLTLQQKCEALRRYVGRYGHGGWRGLSVPAIQVNRFSSPDLAETINELWDEVIDNPEISELLLGMIGAGKIIGCSDLAFRTAYNLSLTKAERIDGVVALAEIGDPRIKNLAKEFSNKPKTWPDYIAKILVIRLFPEYLPVDELLLFLERVEEGKDTIGDFAWYLPRTIAGAEWKTEELEKLRDGLSSLIPEGLEWTEEYPHLISNRPRLTTALAATCVRGLRDCINAEWIRASLIALKLGTRDGISDDSLKELAQMLGSLNSTDNSLLFWEEDKLLQSLRPSSEPWERYVRVARLGVTRLYSDRDLKWVVEALRQIDSPQSDRGMLLEAARLLKPEDHSWESHLKWLRCSVSDLPGLAERIDELLKTDTQERKPEQWEIEHKERKRRREIQEKERHDSWVKFWHEVAENPETAFSVSSAPNTAWNLWRAMKNSGDESRASGWNRKFIESNFGKETADRLREALMQQWRKNFPTLTCERRDDEKHTHLVIWQLGIAAIHAEAEDPDWALKLSHDEAKLAARHSLIEIDNLPSWMKPLALRHPKAVTEILGKELVSNLSEPAKDFAHSILLQKITHSTDSVATLFIPQLAEWLRTNGLTKNPEDNEEGFVSRNGQIISFLDKHGSGETRDFLGTLSKEILTPRATAQQSRIWLPTLIRFEPDSGLDFLEKRLGRSKAAKYSDAVVSLGELFGDRHGGLDLSGSQFTPKILLRLMRLTNSHVQRKYDSNHCGSFTPDERDAAERARGLIESVLLKADGKEGWEAKMEMAADPTCAHFKDRILALAEEQWAVEIDSAVYSDEQVMALESNGETPPSTNEAMFGLLVDRLTEIEDQLLRDTSLRELWATITDEKVMRRAIARELILLRNGLYTVDQEAVTADEKETDIRLRSTVSAHEATIELKQADERTARDLRDTIEKQLVTKYMGAEINRSGCLLLTIARDRKWRHPETQSWLDTSGLLTFLRNEAKEVVQKFGGTFQIHVHLIDLHPRLKTETASPSRKRSEPIFEPTTS